MVRYAGFFVVVVLAVASPLFGQPYMDSAKAALLVQSQHHLFNDDFPRAESLATVFQSKYPGDPGVWLLRSAIMMAEMYHAEDELYDSTYKAAIDSLQDGALRLLTASNDSTTKAWMCLWRASAKAYESLWEAKFGGTYRAVKLGFAARSECEKGLAYDSTVDDLYVGLGTYHYWKSAKAGFLRWIGIFKNEKVKGIRELYRASEQANISRETAESGLIWIWLDMKQYDSTVAKATRMAQRFPQGKSFYWPLGTAYFAMENYAEAARAFERLKAMLEGEPGNYYNWIACDSWLARCYERLGRVDEAEVVGSRFKTYAMKIPERTQDRQKSNIKYLQKWAQRYAAE